MVASCRDFPSFGDPAQTAVDRTKAHRDCQSLERQHLSVADAHVAKAERVVLEQAAALESCRRDGCDTKLAEDAMRVFEANPQVMREHRELIMRAIEGTDDGCESTLAAVDPGCCSLRFERPLAAAGTATFRISSCPSGNART